MFQSHPSRSPAIGTYNFGLLFIRGRLLFQREIALALSLPPSRFFGFDAPVMSPAPSHRLSCRRRIDQSADRRCVEDSADDGWEVAAILRPGPYALWRPNSDCWPALFMPCWLLPSCNCTESGRSPSARTLISKRSYWTSSRPLDILGLGSDGWPMNPSRDGSQPSAIRISVVTTHVDHRVIRQRRW